MLIDTDSVSIWYVINKGFKAHTQCPACKGSRLSYHKAREPGYAGIMTKCLDCPKIMPVRMRQNYLKNSEISILNA